MKKMLRGFAYAGLVLTVLFGAHSLYLSVVWRVPTVAAVSSNGREVAYAAIRSALYVYDPTESKPCDTGPDFLPCGSQCSRIEEVLAGYHKSSLGSWLVTNRAIHNEHITRSSHEFCYQTFDEPRLSDLRERYGLDEVVASGKCEFDRMVLLRNWTRSQFKRNDFQPNTSNFDALLVLDRGLRNQNEPFSNHRHIDPCKFFPLLYCQVLLSMGYQARLVAVNHGMVEVWSDQYCKWILMDAELNHHLVSNGVPLNLIELLDASQCDGGLDVQLIRGEQSSDPNTTQVHLKLRSLSAKSVMAWFADNPIDIADMRNDWMTNHYFRGHPARSDRNSLTFIGNGAVSELPFGHRLRPTTCYKNDFYWSLNQCEIWVENQSSDGLDLCLRTVTPNFKHFEINLDGAKVILTTDPRFRWKLHEGINTLFVRPVNQFGIRGIESLVKLEAATKSTSEVNDVAAAGRGNTASSSWTFPKPVGL